MENNREGFDEMEKDDWKALLKLRTTMDLQSEIPFTIFTFTEVRVRRYEAELAKAKEITEEARKQLFKIGISLGGYNKRMNSSEDCSDIPDKLKKISTQILELRESLNLSK